MWPTSAKKRVSPDADAIRVISSPGNEPQPKRAKLDAFRILGRAQEHLEYREPLRDPGDTSNQSKVYQRISFMKSASPSKKVSNPSIFPPRAQSVPLAEVPAMDLTAIPPSPRRSPSKGEVEIRRALSVPPSDLDDQMDVDASDNSDLLRFTNPNPVQFTPPRVAPTFDYTVNFATPHTPSRTSSLFSAPPSPLTPLPSPPLSRQSSPSVELPAMSSSRRVSNAAPISRPTTLGGTGPKRAPFVSQSPRRVTRSASMKVGKVKDEIEESENSKTTNNVEVSVTSTTPVTETSSELAAIPSPLTTVVSNSRPPKSTMIPKSKQPPTTLRSTSVSKPLPSHNKLKQTSLNLFMKSKPSTVGGGDSTIRASTTTEGSSKPAPTSSPSKIPLPTSPTKRSSTTPQTRNTKLLIFSAASTSTSVGMRTSRAISGRSLSTLSHALDKLVVPPPSRPNTSMGFVRDEGANEDCVRTQRDSKGKQKAKDDALLPPTSTTRGSGTTFARPTASSLNRAATMTELGSTTISKMRGQSRAAIRGMGRGRETIGIFGKAGDRASKKTSLPVVAGSPVKGSGGTDGLDDDGFGADKHASTSSLDVGGVAGEDDVFVSRKAVADINPAQDAVTQVVLTEASSREGYATSRRPSPSVAASGSIGVERIDLTTPISTDKGKQRAMPCSTLNPVSSALHALSESLSSLPHTPTPPKPRAIGTRTGLRSSTTAAGKESPSLDGSGAGLGGSSEVYGSGDAGPNNETVNGSGGAKKSSLKILKRCIIFVDVRTEQGDDAGSLFVDMLKGLGAKITSRLGRKCTHIVYKNGHANTLVRYRMLDDPKPVVVGIAWVVECAEKRAKVDEERFKIDVDVINVVGGTDNKRRRSVLPKHLIPSSPSPDGDVSVHMSSEVDNDDEGAGSVEGSPSRDLDSSMWLREEDDLPPLERARRRNSILPGGQTRLVL